MVWYSAASCSKLILIGNLKRSPQKETENEEFPNFSGWKLVPFSFLCGTFEYFALRLGCGGRKS